MTIVTGSPFRIEAKDMVSRTDDKRALAERYLRDLGYELKPIVRDELKWGLKGEQQNTPGIGLGMVKTQPDRIVVQ